MKTQSTFIVIRRRKTGKFLKKYRNNPSVLSFTADFTDHLEAALFIPLNYYLEDKTQYKALAKMLESEIVKVEANYQLTYPNGSEVMPKTFDVNEEGINGIFGKFLKSLSEVTLDEHY